LPVTYRGQPGASRDVQPSGQVEVTSLYETFQAVIGRKSSPYNGSGCYLSREDIRASIDGCEVPFETTVPPGEHAETSRRRINVSGQDLSPGTHTVRIDARDAEGALRRAETVFHYYPDGRIPMGDSSRWALRPAGPGSRAVL
jgi:hypothetical protein